jgi:transposase-like protein
MKPACPHCKIEPKCADGRPNIVSIGHYHRKSDSRDIQRFRCKGCARSFSRATSHPCVNQNKRHRNEPLRRLLCSGVTQRRAAILLSISRTTVVRKLLFLESVARRKLAAMNSEQPLEKEFQFDELVTFEHTKCKPISVIMAVTGGRRILGLKCASQPAFGLLKNISIKKYGKRKDDRPKARKELLALVQPLVDPSCDIKTDMNPHYKADVRELFPHAIHKTYKGRRGAVVGQGELKKIGRDPIFSFNHTAAKCRADISRLFRRTWNTTKKLERLEAHLIIYAVYHNEVVQAQEAKKALKKLARA